MILTVLIGVRVAGRPNALPVDSNRLSGDTASETTDEADEREYDAK